MLLQNELSALRQVSNFTKLIKIIVLPSIYTLHCKQISFRLQYFNSKAEKETQLRGRTEEWEVATVRKAKQSRGMGGCNCKESKAKQIKAEEWEVATVRKAKQRNGRLQL